MRTNYFSLCLSTNGFILSSFFFLNFKFILFLLCSSHTHPRASLNTVRPFFPRPGFLRCGGNCSQINCYSSVRECSSFMGAFKLSLPPHSQPLEIGGLTTVCLIFPAWGYCAPWICGFVSSISSRIFVTTVCHLSLSTSLVRRIATCSSQLPSTGLRRNPSNA